MGFFYLIHFTATLIHMGGNSTRITEMRRQEEKGRKRGKLRRLSRCRRLRHDVKSHVVAPTTRRWFYEASAVLICG